MLDGYGPIPASMARDLVANGAEILLPGPRGPPRRRTPGDRPDQLPAHQSHETCPSAPGRQMHLPRLQQPVPGQRHRPPHRLGPRRSHRHQQPGPALPEAPSDSNTTAAGHPPPRPETSPPAGPHPPAGNTKAEPHHWEPPHWPPTTARTPTQTPDRLPRLAGPRAPATSTSSTPGSPSERTASNGSSSPQLTMPAAGSRA